MKILIHSTLLALVFSTVAVTAQAQTVNKKALTLEGARKVIVAAEDAARRKNAPGGAIAIVDEGGNLILMERLDNTFAAAANVSIGKARTAAIFKHPTSFFETAINKGRTALVAMPDFTPLQGGVLIEVDGEIVGAIGVSGTASAQQDEEIAIAGAKAIEQP
jgi:glc operon protein GlcG